MEHASQYLFNIGPLKVTGYVTTMWVIMAILGTVSYLATRNLDERSPTGLQNIMEMVVEGLLNFFGGVVGHKSARMFLPYLCTMFLFVLMSNYTGLIPGAGYITGFAAPSSTLSVTAGLAICTFFGTQYFGFKVHGVGYLKSFVEPIAILLPLNIVEHLVRPLSLSLRLFGNIYGEEMTLGVLLLIVPYFVPILMLGLSMLLGGIQALVFTLLSSIYFMEATH